MGNGKTVLVEENASKKAAANWEMLEKLVFSGPKTNCVKEIDLLQ